MVRPEHSHPHREVRYEEPDSDAGLVVAWRYAIARGIVHLHKASNGLVDRPVQLHRPKARKLIESLTGLPTQVGCVVVDLHDQVNRITFGDAERVLDQIRVETR